MILFSYNANGDLKHVGEFINLILMIGAATIFSMIALAVWLFYKSHSSRRAEQEEDRRHLRYMESLADEHRRDG